MLFYFYSTFIFILNAHKNRNIILCILEGKRKPTVIVKTNTIHTLDGKDNASYEDFGYVQ